MEKYAYPDAFAAGVFRKTLEYFSTPERGRNDVQQRLQEYLNPWSVMIIEKWGMKQNLEWQCPQSIFRDEG